MNYAVTYCTYDEKFSGNILWHSAIFLSQWNEGEKMEVVDGWGYYAMPMVDEDDSLSSKVVKCIGLNIDIHENHTLLCHEEWRYMYLGYGLHGVTIELTKDKFDALQNKCEAIFREERGAIKEIADKLGIKPKSPEDTKIHPYENASRAIFAVEKYTSKQEERPSRLKPFEITITCTMWGPAMNKSHNCKSHIVAVLVGILSPEQIARITCNGKHPTLPRWSGVVEDIYLHSSGPLHKHTKSAGEIVHYRESKDPGAKLCWTLPPQEFIGLSEDSAKSLHVNKEYCDEIKKVISMLQQLEWLFINAEIPVKYHTYQQQVINSIQQSYDAFSIVEPKKNIMPTKNWNYYFSSLLSLPHNQDDWKLIRKLTNAKNLLNSLYMAIVDGWKIYDDCKSESELKESDKAHNENPVEAIATYLTIKDKQKLCSIIGRSYDIPTPSRRVQAPML